MQDINELHDQAQTMREAIEDEISEIKMIVKEIEYIIERLQGVRYVAISLEDETYKMKEAQTNEQ